MFTDLNTMTDDSEGVVLEHFTNRNSLNQIISRLAILSGGSYDDFIATEVARILQDAQARDSLLQDLKGIIDSSERYGLTYLIGRLEDFPGIETGFETIPNIQINPADSAENNRARVVYQLVLDLYQRLSVS